MFILFKHLLFALIAPVLGIFPAWVCASSQGPAVNFSLSPRLCVLGTDESECTGTVTLKWQTTTLLSACLFQDGKSEPLQCWDKNALGNYTLKTHTVKSTRFYLATAEGKILAEGWFEVLQQQTARKRRRNPWSFY